MRIAVAFLLCATTVIAADDVQWTRIELDSAFRSEGVAVADINNDGRKDVIAGDVWYAAPDWKMYPFREVGEFVAGKGYSNSFANFTWDINQDGWQDIIVVGFPGAPFHWYENPGKTGSEKWSEHMIWHSICNESPEFEDIDGDGTPELIFGSQPERQMGYVKIPPKDQVTKKWDFVPISEPGEIKENGTFKYYHGLGLDDVNGDGREDVIIPHGWWEQPNALGQGTWKWHAAPLAKPESKEPEKAGYLYTGDFDGDGDADVLASSAHAFGVWWFEQSDSGWKYHLIDESYSQTHATERADLNGDGQPDFVTGKRFYAHNGRDPGGKDKVVMYWYEVTSEDGVAKFTAHEIKAGEGTGVGTQFVINDINADGKPDIVLSNKKGVNILLQK